MLLDWRSLATAADRDRFVRDHLAGLWIGEPRRVADTPGGRAAALDRLRCHDATGYGQRRNHLDGPVSRLSPYLRHGMLAITEVRDHLRERYAGQPERTEEYLRQLAWRDFFEKVLDWHGDGLDDDLEEPKHNVPRADALPADVAAGRTGLPCIDGMLAELFAAGYLHNHERLWFAAYLCHFRGVRWQQGARLFRQHLLDGDRASNGSSWQWVESTFAGKPYYMNRENVATFSGGKWCDTCTARCPFDASYETLQHRLFGGNVAPLPLGLPHRPPPASDGVLRPDASSSGSPVAVSTLVWVHDAALRPTDPAVAAHPDAALVFVLDEPALRAEPWAFHRLAFVLDGVAELFAASPHPVKQLRLGDPAAELAAVAADLRAAELAATDHPNPRVRRVLAGVSGLSVVAHPRPVLAEYAGEPRRFSRYWEAVAKQVLGYAPKGEKHRK